MIKILKNRFFQLAILTVIVNLWVLWVENNWFFLLNIVIAEVFFIKKINWRFWQKKDSPYKLKHELIDAFVLALFLSIFFRTFFVDVFVIPTPSMEKTLRTGDFIFVSKLHYGPRMPITPVDIPFTHNKIPGTDFKSYISKVSLPYKRLKGFTRVKHNDVVVFNLPVGDTVVPGNFQQDYYQLKRQHYNDSDFSDYKTIGHPIDKRDYYIKRCVGLPGDTFQVIRGKIVVNQVPLYNPVEAQYNYYIKTNGVEIPAEEMEKLDIEATDIKLNKSTWLYDIPLTAKNVDMLKLNENVQGIRRQEKVEASVFNYTIFPYSIFYLWTEDHFGPLYIPAKGDTVWLDARNLSLYQRAIEAYEGNRVILQGDRIFINGIETKIYIFKKDYYFMMGDNRHNSYDSRYWGLVPYDHIVGKAIFVWLSLDKKAQLPTKLRWKQIFKIIR